MLSLDHTLDFESKTGCEQHFMLILKGVCCARSAPFRGSYVQGDGVEGELAHFHHLRSAGEEILNAVTERRV